jgi:cytochrome c oxidase subunit II
LPTAGLPGEDRGPRPLAIPDRSKFPVLTVLAGTGALLAACAPSQTFIQNTPSMLEPRGPAAYQAAFLWWVFLILGTLIYLGVMGFLVFSVLRRRGDQAPDLSYSGRNLILWGGIVLPTLVLLVLFGLTLRAMAINPAGEAGSLTIEVIGRQWWWEVHYTDHQFYTANELRIPAGQPVEIKLRSEDVIHSFWVPQLSGKLDLNPGRTNTLWLQADEPGEYWGECAEFCGVQHAKMQFVVVAEEPEAFAAWLAAQQQPAAQPVGELAVRGQEVFLDGSCIYCHTVRGTHATGELGPDLTHLASRLTLGAGAIANTPGGLAGWVADPQGIKPGNKMPPIENMSSEDFQALLAYLQSLE